MSFSGFRRDAPSMSYRCWPDIHGFPATKRLYRHRCGAEPINRDRPISLLRGTRLTTGAVTMIFARRDFLHLTLGAVACASVLSAALALDYPTRPVTIIVPFAAGGPADITGRKRNDDGDRTRRIIEG